MGGVDALVADVEGTDSQGLIAAAVANDHGYIFVMLTADWETYEPIFNAMLDSVEFFPPE
jgi:hypothetical protein